MVQVVTTSGALALDGERLDLDGTISCKQRIIVALIGSLLAQHHHTPMHRNPPF